MMQMNLSSVCCGFGLFFKIFFNYLQLFGVNKMYNNEIKMCNVHIKFDESAFPLFAWVLLCSVILQKKHANWSHKSEKIKYFLKQ